MEMNLLFYNRGQEAEFSRNVEREGGENRKQVQKLYVNADGWRLCWYDNGGGVFSVPRIMEEREPLIGCTWSTIREMLLVDIWSINGARSRLFGLRTLLLRRLLPLSVQVLAVLSPTARKKPEQSKVEIRIRPLSDERRVFALLTITTRLNIVVEEQQNGVFMPSCSNDTDGPLSRAKKRSAERYWSETTGEPV